MDAVRQQHGDKLRDAGQAKVGFQGFCILRFPPGQSEAALEMVYGTFDGCADFICAVPFIRPAQDAGVRAVVLFRTDIEHPPAGGIRAGIRAGALTFLFPGIRVTHPLCHGTDELIADEAVFPFCRSPGLHGQGRVIGAARNAVFVDGAAGTGDAGAFVKRDTGFAEMPVFAEGVTGQEFFMNIRRIKSGVAGECLRIDEGMRFEEILQSGYGQPCVADGLIPAGQTSSSGDLDFFPTGISLCSLRKSSS